MLCGVFVIMDIGIFVLVVVVGLFGIIMVWWLGFSLNMIDIFIVLIIVGYIVFNWGWSYFGI